MKWDYSPRLVSGLVNAWGGTSMLKKPIYMLRIQRLEKRKPVLFGTGFLSIGWKMGFEPTTPGTTIQCSNQLSYIHH
jgi:hypothetical protein